MSAIIYKETAKDVIHFFCTSVVKYFLKLNISLHCVKVHNGFYFGVQEQPGRERAPIVCAFWCSVDNGAERKKTHLFTDKLVWTGSQ